MRRPASSLLACLAYGTLASFASLAPLCPSPLAADERTAVLGAGGALYRVLTGTYGELFPGGHETEAANPVLALEIREQDQPAVRVLVPDTAGPEEEKTPALVYESSSTDLFVVWESKIHHFYSRLNLVELGAGVWSEPIEVSGNPFAAKYGPRLAVTRDRFERDGQEVARTIFHLVWAEESGATLKPMYTPVVLLDGLYLGWNQVLELSAFDPHPAEPISVASPALLQSPAVTAGRDGRSVVVGFANAATGRLVSLEMEVAPAQLRQLADALAAAVEDADWERTPQGAAALAADARAHVIVNGTEFHPSIVDFLAGEAERRVLEYLAQHPDATPGQLAGDVRGHIIVYGVGALGAHLRLPNGPAPPAPTVIEVTGGSGAADPLLILASRVAADPLAPSTAANAPHTLHLSRDGAAALVAWEPNQRTVLYRESRPDGTWSGEMQLDLGPGLSLREAHALLAQRLAGN